MDHRILALLAACSPETATETNNEGEDQANTDTDLGQDTGTEMAQDFEISILSPQSGELETPVFDEIAIQVQ
jgi:hypothetical protein